MRVRRPSYSAEFRADAVELLRKTDRSLPTVADDLGVSCWSLRQWYRRAEMAKGRKPGRASPRTAPPAEETPDERVKRLEREVTALRKENESLKMDREILKKAAAFFAKENE